MLFPSDLGRTDRGRYQEGGERGAPDLLLDMLEGEGVRMARPITVSVEVPQEPDAEDAPLKLDAAIARAVVALAEVVESVNADANFPLILGGDQIALWGHIMGHSDRHQEGIGLAVLSDGALDLGTPGPPVYDDAARLGSDPEVSETGNAHGMILSGALRMIPDDFAIGKLLRKSAVQAAQTSVVGVRGPLTAALRANEKAAGIEVWRMERLELDGESAYRSMLSRHLSEGPIILSIDATGLDPDLMTAVRDPRSDGLDWSFLKRSLEQCLPHVDRILGLDVSELDPTQDDAHHGALLRFGETLAPFLRKLTR